MSLKVGFTGRLFIYGLRTNVAINIVINLCAIHARRVTIQVKDMQLVRRIKNHTMGGIPK
jgi:hypothetical protein